ncbi:transglycosylase family protein [Streptomyces sp. NBC_01197]|uniref:transglycosylase family protein n=1 Tax=Streptomyces sp. NBC_01197 TaxID=2903768 RepID=UPI002E1451E9|nr:transglycosylase family protein [Streptomyces sp. NBC_01197]
MRTGNGRHRRPRQAPALVVAAGVTGSAIALPLLASTGAHAADATTWDRVALCESGGIWSTDLGNGHYGGLQFSQATWDKYGGGQYAARADLASRSQQIAVAQKVYAAEGAAPWASCAAIAGLTKDDADTALVDPGAPDTASPSPTKATGSAGDPLGADTSADGSKQTSSTQAPSKQASPSPSDSHSGSSSSSSPSSPASDPSSDASDSSRDSGHSDTPDTSATSDSSASAAPGPSDSAPPAPSGSATSDGPDSGNAPAPSGAGKHRGGEAAGDTGASRDETGRHASRGGETSREDARTEGSYTVRAGDNLWSIAEAHDLPGGWPALYAANHRTVGGDPDFIVPGQSLDLDRNQG